MVDAFVFMIGSGCAVLNVLLILFLIYDPTGIFLGELIPPRYFYFPVKLAVILFHTYLLIVLCVSGAFIAGISCAFGFYFGSFVSRELRLGRGKDAYKANDILRKYSHLTVAYRGFQILMHYSTSVYGIYLVIFNAVSILGSSFSNFALIKYWNDLELTTKAPLLIGNTFIIMGWSCVLGMGRFLFSKGKKVLASWDRYEWPSALVQREMRKFRMSCKPFALCYGTTFVVGRDKVLTFFKGVTRGTMRALLTTKS